MQKIDHFWYGFESLETASPKIFFDKISSFLNLSWWENHFEHGFREVPQFHIHNRNFQKFYKIYQISTFLIKNIFLNKFITIFTKTTKITILILNNNLK